MNQRTALITGSILGLLAVGIGAFGAHALKAVLEVNGRAETFELAVRYQFYHTMAILGAGILLEKIPSLRLAPVLFLVGTIIFSGSLYILSLTNQSWWGAITPIGGVSLIAGWARMAWSFVQSK
ncbi:MAG: DUF423 domain-containing protein [Cyclobacteriaceae bacterium]|nr:DUF423 domain-containing protein [Cyclobacteriaceae bacterium]